MSRFASRISLFFGCLAFTLLLLSILGAPEQVARADGGGDGVQALKCNENGDPNECNDAHRPVIDNCFNYAGSCPGTKTGCANAILPTDCLDCKCQNVSGACACRL